MNEKIQDSTTHSTTSAEISQDFNVEPTRVSIVRKCFMSGKYRGCIFFREARIASRRFWRIG